jgi:hypothetical protein
MQDLANYGEFMDHADRVVYRVWSNRKLSDEEITKVIRKKSLHEIVASHAFYPGQPPYQIIKVIAADGWESAD